LDGTNVDSTELTEARNKYKGRLTRDMLKDCIGHKEFSVVKALDLSDQKIRHCGDVFESRDLMGLTELNLNDNMISSIQTLRFEFHNCINAAASLLRMCCIPPLCSSSLLYHPVVSC
jgi:hypothetical protein